MPESIIQLTGLHFGYPDRPLILDGLELTLSEGERVGLTGPNGCGKTTVLSLIMGLKKPLSGSIKIFGQPCQTEKEFQMIRPKLGFVFQDANDQLFCPTVADDIGFGPLNIGLGRQMTSEIVSQILTKLGLEGFGERVTYDLSGGEKKLVALGTALALNPKLLILDEPTNFLDEKAVQRLTEIILASGLPCLVVSHDREFLDRIATRRLLMESGKIKDF